MDVGHFCFRIRLRLPIKISVIGGCVKIQISAIALVLSSALWAGPREDAYKMHNRLTGTPPSNDVLLEMESLISQGNAEAAARLAMENKNFINIIIKNWAKPFTNREQTSRVELNDYAATIMGAVRDDIRFDRVLYDDILYTVSGQMTAYSSTDNTHYKSAEDSLVDFSTALTQVQQSSLTGLPATATSGVLTTRAAGESFYSAGTNRRVNRYTFMNYLCHDYEDLHDTSIPDYKVRRDVERNPGGDSRTYKNTCVGCHAGQDSIAGAYAFYDFPTNKLEYNPGTVSPKINAINNYKDGHQVVDDSWFNLWKVGVNSSKLGFKGASQGNGARSLNSMLTKSQAFSQCMAKKVFKLVCKKEAVNTDDVNFVNSQAQNFESNYSLRTLIAKTSAGCLINED